MKIKAGRPRGLCQSITLSPSDNVYENFYLMSADPKMRMTKLGIMEAVVAVMPPDTKMVLR